MSTLVVILRVIGGLILAVGLIRLILIGKAHHDSSGEAPLTPTFQPMEPHLVRKAHSGIKMSVVGGVFLLLAWAIAAFKGL